MQLIIKSFDTHVIDTDEYGSVADLKIFLANTDDLPIDNLSLYHGSSVLSNDCALNTLPVDSFLDVFVPMLGGKVHGSLARAGKVKAQTPKVEKQEKSKRPRGRAKRRMQHIKRFVAVVPQLGGRRRGPNANIKA